MRGMGSYGKQGALALKQWYLLDLSMDHIVSGYHTGLVVLTRILKKF